MLKKTSKVLINIKTVKSRINNKIIMMLVLLFFSGITQGLIGYEDLQDSDYKNIELLRNVLPGRIIWNCKDFSGATLLGHSYQIYIPERGNHIFINGKGFHTLHPILRKDSAIYIHNRDISEVVYLNHKPNHILGLPHYIPYTNPTRTQINQLPVFMFHVVVKDKKDVLNDMYITQDKLRDFLIDLQKKGYQAILPRDLELYQEHQVPLPQKPVMITFDDGYICNYELAFPVLKELGIKATIFVIGKSLEESDGRTRYFNIEQAQEMYRSGLVSIQPHTYDLHKDPEKVGFYGKGFMPFKGEDSEQYLQRIDADIKRNNELILTHIGDRATMFAYPYGLYNSRAERILKNNGIIATATVEHGINRNIDDFYLLNRINVSQRYVFR